MALIFCNQTWSQSTAQRDIRKEEDEMKISFSDWEKLEKFEHQIFYVKMFDTVEEILGSKRFWLNKIHLTFMDKVRLKKGI